MTLLILRMEPSQIRTLLELTLTLTLILRCFPFPLADVVPGGAIG
jgi:hypothetical protein